MIALMLTAVGALCIIVRAHFMRSLDPVHGGNAWQLTYDVRFYAHHAGGKIRVSLPNNTTHARIYRETFSHPGTSMDFLRLKYTGDREAVLVPTMADMQYQFLAQFDIHLQTNGKKPSYTLNNGLTPDERARYLQKETDIQLKDPHVVQVMAELTRDKVKKSQILERIYNYCCENITRGHWEDHSDAAGTLVAGEGTVLGRARAMVALCRVARIPARLVTGFIIKNSEDAQKHFWVETYAKNGWKPYDPEYGYANDLPATYLEVRRGSTDVVKVQNDIPCQIKYSFNRIIPSPGVIASVNNRPINILELTRLPPGMQHVIGLILLLPLASLITAIFRNMIGIKTFGTFGPGLLALSFVNTDWKIGTIVLVFIVGIGLAVRLVLNKMRLHMVARLSIILTCVVISITMSISVLDYLQLTPSASAVLFPMVILTMMIERFNVTVEEDGLKYTIKVFAGTFVVTACCLAVLRTDLLSRLVLMYPEGQLIIIAVLLLIGRYAGYRLSELWRFRDITSSASWEGTP
jgi:hypothetical protein